MTVELDAEALAATQELAWRDESVITDATITRIVTAYLEAVEARKPVLQVRLHDGPEYRWTAYDTRNNLVVAASTQGYNDPRDRDHNIEMVLGGGYRLDIS